MIIRPKEIVLANGQKATLKSPEVADAKALLAHMRKTSEETPFMARYPEEILTTEEDEKEFIGGIRDDSDAFMIAAYIENELAGNAGIQRIGRYIKMRHRASFGISIQRKAWNLGLGTAMLKEVLACVRKTAFEQVELTVLLDNARAKHLYESVGFKQIGIHPRAVKDKDGGYHDEIRMVYPVEK